MSPSYATGFQIEIMMFFPAPLVVARQIIRCRVTSTVRRPQINQGTCSKGEGVTKPNGISLKSVKSCSDAPDSRLGNNFSPRMQIIPTKARIVCTSNSNFPGKFTQIGTETCWLFIRLWMICKLIVFIKALKCMYSNPNMISSKFMINHYAIFGEVTDDAMNYLWWIWGLCSFSKHFTSSLTAVKRHIWVVEWVLE